MWTRTNIKDENTGKITSFNIKVWDYNNNLVFDKNFEDMIEAEKAGQDQERLNMIRAEMDKKYPISEEDANKTDDELLAEIMNDDSI